MTTHPTDLRQQPGVCPECKGSCRTGSGYLREDCPACNGTGQQPAQPESGEQAARFVATEFGSIADTASQYVWLTLDHPGRSEQRLAYARAIAAALNANPPKEAK
jgi:uncharacterized protein (DUF983 family)